MALSKLAISLLAGIGSVAAIGGITAGVVVSNNKNAVSVVEEEKTESKEDKKPSSFDSRNKTMNQNDQQSSSSTNDKSTTIKADESGGEKATNSKEVVSVRDKQISKQEKEKSAQETQSQIKDMGLVEGETFTTTQSPKGHGSSEQEEVLQRGEDGKMHTVQADAEKQLPANPMEKNEQHETPISKGDEEQAKSNLPTDGVASVSPVAVKIPGSDTSQIAMDKES